MSQDHGRRERRAIRVSSARAGYPPLPGLGQVAQVTTEVVRLRTGEVSAPTRYLLTSLTPTQATPQRLLVLSRGQWGIENRLVHVTDDSSGADRHVLQTHTAGAVLHRRRTAVLTLSPHSESSL